MNTRKLLLTSLLAAATMSATAFAWTTGADGLPDTSGISSSTSTKIADDHTVTADTIYNFTDTSGTENSPVTVTLSDGADVKLNAAAAGTMMAIGTISGTGDVWFAQGRWRYNANSTFNSTGTIYMQGGQFWVTGQAFTTSNDVVLGSSTFSEGISSLDNAALRVGSNVTFNGTTTVVENAKIGFQGSSTLTIATLSGNGNITTGCYDGTNNLVVSNANDFTGNISIVDGVSLTWSSSTATFGGLSGGGSVAAGSKLNIAKAGSDSTTFTGTVGASGNGVALDVSGTGTQGFSGTSWFSTVSVGNAADASDGFTMVDLSGTTNVSETITVKNLSLLSIAESGSLDFNTMNIEAGGMVTLAGTVKINSASDLITVASGGSLAVAQSTVVFDIASSLFTDNAATLTIASGNGNFYSWNQLKAKNFSVDGVLISGRSEVDSSTNGQVSITFGTAANLVWAGTTAENGNIWDADNAGNKIWTNAALTTEDKSDAFYTRDNVTFNDAAANKTVSIGGNLTVGTITVSADGYTFSATDDATIKSGNISVTASNLTLSADAGKTLTFSSSLKNDSNSEKNAIAKITKTGDGIVNIANDTRVQALDVQGGTLEFGTSASGMISNFKIASGATLTIVAGNDFATWGSTTYDIAGTLNMGTCRFSIKEGSFTLTGGTITGTGDSNDDYASALDFYGDTTVTTSGNSAISAKTNIRAGKTATFDVADGATLNISGILRTGDSGTATFKKTGAGALTLSGNTGANSGQLALQLTAGDTTISAGTKTVKSLSISGGALNISGGTTTMESLSITGGVTTISGGTTTATNGTTVDNGGVLVVSNGGQDSVVRGGLHVLNGGTARFTHTDVSGWSSSPANRLGNITIDAGGVLELNADGNETFGGTLTLNGVIKKGAGAAENATPKFLLWGNSAKIVTTEQGARIDASVKFGLKEVDSVIDVQGDTASLEIASVVSKDTEGNGALKKQGTGTLILSGANTYDGGTTIEGGVLVAANASALGSGAVTVAADAKLGLVAGTTVTVTNGINLADGAALVVDLSGKASATETFTLDLVSGTALKYNGAAFDEDCTSLISEGIVVLENMNLDGWTQSLSYSGNTLQLTLTIPEPSTFGLLAGLGALALAGTRRRRRK